MRNKNNEIIKQKQGVLFMGEGLVISGIVVNGQSTNKKNNLSPFLNSFYMSNHCKVCGTEAATGCGKCREIIYCSSKCQEADWPEHSKVCGKTHPASPYEKLRQMYSLKCYVGNGKRPGSTQGGPEAPPTTKAKGERITVLYRLSNLYNTGLLPPVESRHYLPLLLKLAVIPPMKDNVIEKMLLAMPGTDSLNSVREAILFIGKHKEFYTSPGAAEKFLKDTERFHTPLCVLMMLDSLTLLLSGQFYRRPGQLAEEHILEIIPMPPEETIRRIIVNIVKSFTQSFYVRPTLFHAIPDWMCPPISIADYFFYMLNHFLVDDHLVHLIFAGNKFPLPIIRQFFAYATLGGDLATLQMFTAKVPPEMLVTDEPFFIHNTGMTTSEWLLAIKERYEGEPVVVDYIKDAHWESLNLWELACGSVDADIVDWFAKTFRHPEGDLEVVFPDYLYAPFFWRGTPTARVEMVERIIPVLPTDEATKQRLLGHLLNESLRSDPPFVRYIVQHTSRPALIRAIYNSLNALRPLEHAHRKTNPVLFRYTKALCKLFEDQAIGAHDIPNPATLRKKWLRLYQNYWGDETSHILTIGGGFEGMDPKVVSNVFAEICKDGDLSTITAWCNAGVLEIALVDLPTFFANIMETSRHRDSLTIPLWLLTRFGETKALLETTTNKLPTPIRQELAKLIVPGDPRIQTPEWALAIKNVIHPEDFRTEFSDLYLYVHKYFL